MTALIGADGAGLVRSLVDDCDRRLGDRSATLVRYRAGDRANGLRRGHAGKDASKYRNRKNLTGALHRHLLFVPSTMPH